MGLISSLFNRSLPLVEGEVKFIDKVGDAGIGFYSKDVKDVEMIWLCIYHFAKMMYITPSSMETSELISGLTHLENSDYIQHLKNINQNLANTFQYNKGIRKFKSILSYQNIYSRKIKTYLPSHCTPVDSMRTILLLSLFTLDNCGEDYKNLLVKCLSKQASLYHTSVEPHKILSLIQTPIDVFQFGNEVSRQP